MRPQTWYDVPPQILIQHPAWRQTADMVLREFRHVLVLQHSSRVYFDINEHPACFFEFARRINAYREN